MIYTNFAYLLYKLNKTAVGSYLIIVTSIGFIIQDKQHRRKRNKYQKRKRGNSTKQERQFNK